MNECVTCDLPEDHWPVGDLLYLEGASQCPHCRRVDLNDEATRKHNEK